MAGASAKSDPASRAAPDDEYDRSSHLGTVRCGGRVPPGECTDSAGVRVLRPTNALDETSSANACPYTAC